MMLEQSYMTRPRMKNPDVRFFGEVPKRGLPQEETFKQGAMSFYLAGLRGGKSMLAAAMASQIRENLSQQGFSRKVMPVMSVGSEGPVDFVPGRVEVTGHDASGSMKRESFGLHGAITGRTSSREPNMQNIPREVIVPPAYEGAARVGVGAYGKPLLADVFEMLDSSKLRANRLLMSKHDYNDILAWSAQTNRQNAKLINFAMAYGASPEKAAEAIYVAVYSGGITGTQFLENQFFGRPKYTIDSITEEDRRVYEHDTMQLLQQKAVQEIREVEDREFSTHLESYAKKDADMTKSLYDALEVGEYAKE